MEQKPKFDKTYLLLLPFVMGVYIPWISTRIRIRYVFPFFLMWLFMMTTSGRPAMRFPMKVKTSLAYAVVFLVLFFQRSLLFYPFGHGVAIAENSLFQSALIVIPLVILHTSLAYGKQRELGVLAIWLLLCMAITCVMTIRGEILTPGASRSITGGGGAGSDLRLAYELSLAGIAKRWYIYLVGLLVAPLLYFSKHKSRLLKFFGISCACLFLYTAYMASYTSCMAGILLGCGIYLLFKIGIHVRLIKIVGVILVVSVVVTMTNPRSVAFLESPLLKLRDMTDNQVYQKKIQAIVTSIDGYESEATGRAELYWHSWKTFCAHPLFGVGIWEYLDRGQELGGHSVIFDTLGNSGLLGISLLVLSFVFIFRYLSAISAIALGMHWWPVVNIFMFPYLAFLILNNIYGYVPYTALFLILPGLACLYREPSGMKVKHSYHMRGELSDALICPESTQTGVGRK